jgi:hypothetical protein
MGKTIRVKRLYGLVVLKVRNRADGFAQLNAIDPGFAQAIAPLDVVCRHYPLPGYAWLALLPSCKMRRCDWELQPDAFKARRLLRQGISLN